MYIYICLPYTTKYIIKFHYVILYMLYTLDIIIAHIFLHISCLKIKYYLIKKSENRNKKTVQSCQLVFE